MSNFFLSESVNLEFVKLIFKLLWDGLAPSCQTVGSLLGTLGWPEKRYYKHITFVIDAASVVSK
jgi:hypothetical protein